MIAFYRRSERTPDVLDFVKHHWPSASFIVGLKDGEILIAVPPEALKPYQDFSVEFVLRGRLLFIDELDGQPPAVQHRLWLEMLAAAAERGYYKVLPPL